VRAVDLISGKDVYLPLAMAPQRARHGKTKIGLAIPLIGRCVSAVQGMLGTYTSALRAG
jgi:hypothetical protein